MGSRVAILSQRLMILALLGARESKANDICTLGARAVQACNFELKTNDIGTLGGP